MEFLRNKLTVTEAAPGLSESFFADLLEPRPAYETLAAFKDWAASAQQHMLRAQTRKNCPLAWVGIFVDKVGVAIVLHFTKGVQLRAAQTAASTLTQFFEKEMQQALWANLHPLDELDLRRIDGWHTPMSLRPQGLGKKRAREEEEDEGCQVLAKRSKTRAQFLAECDKGDADDDEEPTDAPLLCIQDAGSAPAQKNIDSREFLSDLPGTWEYRAKREATIVVTECGTRPTLTFVRCHHEARRLQLIVQAVRDEYERFGMLAVVRVATALAKSWSHSQCHRGSLAQERVCQALHGRPGRAGCKRRTGHRQVAQQRTKRHSQNAGQRGRALPGLLCGNLSGQEARMGYAQSNGAVRPLQCAKVVWPLLENQPRYGQIRHGPEAPEVSRGHMAFPKPSQAVAISA